VEVELNRIVDALAGLVWTTLPDGRSEFFNQQWCEYTGRATQESAAGGWLQAVHPDDHAMVLTIWQRCLNAGHAGEAHARIRRHDGVHRWFLIRISPVCDESGNVVRWCGLNADIDDDKRTKAALHIEESFRLVVDNLPVPIMLLEPKGEVLYANHKALEHTGGTLPEAVNWKSQVHPDDRQVTVAIQASIDRGEPFDVDWRHRPAGSAYSWMRARGTPVRDDGGRLVLWCCHVTDIEERRRAEALLAGEKRLLEMVARGDPLHAVLDALCQLGEEIDSSCYNGILLIDPVSKTYQRGGASSLMASYFDAIQDIQANAELGPSAAAICSASQVVIEDIASDPRCWSQRWRELSLKIGLRASWSTPIFSRGKEVLGAFAIYRIESGTPSPFQLELIEQLAHIASIVIERAQSDLALRRSTECFRAIIETTPECVKLVASNGAILQANAASACMIGVPHPDVLMGKCFFDVVAFEDRQRYVDFHQNVCAGEKGTLEFDIITAQCERRNMESYSAPMELADGTVAQLGVMRDITSRRLAEAELRRHEALMAKAQKISSTGSFSWRPQSDEIHWSEQTYRIFGIDPGVRVTLAAIAERVHPGDIHLMSDMIDRAKYGLDLEYEHRLQMPDGSIKHVYMQAHPSHDHEGKLEYIGALRDMTEHQQSEEALYQLRAELAHVTRANSLGALTASIAHEINQPLAGIMTNANTGFRMLSAEPPNVKGALQTVQRTLRDGRRASDVVTRLRALFSKKVVSSEQVDLNEAAWEVVELLRSVMRRKRIVLQQDRADDLPPITGDRVQLQQVVLNLLLNAIEAMQGVEDRSRQLMIKTECETDGGVRLSVADTGTGFGPQQSEKMFDSFYTTKGNGMGLGLSVSRSIVEIHGGRLWASLNDGPGATFSFSIPSQSCCTAAFDRSDKPLHSSAKPAINTGVIP
jgi:PAS domain S-box-containing protein